jgi:hypothetical protein
VSDHPSRISKVHGAFEKGHLIAKMGTSPGHGDVFEARPKVKVILWGFFSTKLAFGHQLKVTKGSSVLFYE